MTQRKILPDHAAQAIDDTLMAHNSAIRKLNGALRLAESIEQQVLILYAINELHSSDKKLRDIRRKREPQNAI
jgi:hypothetical protein